jgi:DNA-directed RNA polymerase subunit F
MKNYELTRFQAVQIVNIGPTTPEELKTLIDLRTMSLTDEQLEEIAEIMESKVR